MISNKSKLKSFLQLRQYLMEVTFRILLDSRVRKASFHMLLTLHQYLIFLHGFSTVLFLALKCKLLFPSLFLILENYAYFIFSFVQLETSSIITFFCWSLFVISVVLPHSLIGYFVLLFGQQLPVKDGHCISKNDHIFSKE